jgi:hypothetical protein
MQQVPCPSLSVASDADDGHALEPTESVGHIAFAVKHLFAGVAPSARALMTVCALAVHMPGIQQATTEFTRWVERWRKNPRLSVRVGDDGEGIWEAVWRRLRSPIAQLGDEEPSKWPQIRRQRPNSTAGAPNGPSRKIPSGIKLLRN